MTGTAGAAVIGSIGAFVMAGTSRLLSRFQVDDVIDAVAVHAGAGVWGTLAVALFGHSELVGTELSPWRQFGVQLMGIVVCCVWSFGIAFVVLRLLNRRLPLRVTPQAELDGLNVSEHGATTELLDLVTVMSHQADTGDLIDRVRAEPFTEVGRIASLYNRVLDALQKADTALRSRSAELERSNADLQQFAYAVSHDLGEPLRGISGFTRILETQAVDRLDDRDS